MYPFQMALRAGFRADFGANFGAEKSYRVATLLAEAHDAVSGLDVVQRLHGLVLDHEVGQPLVGAHLRDIRILKRYIR